MILQEGSIFYYLPQELGRRNLLLLDTLRFSIEMIDYNWNQLYTILLSYSEGNLDIRKRAVLFNYAWIVIDNIDRFSRIYEKLPSDFSCNGLSSTTQIRAFRNTFAHLDDRIDEVFLKTHTPFFGTLSWVYKNTEKRTLNPHIAVSGLNYGGQHKFQIPNYSNNLPIISNVLLQSTDNNEKNSVFLDALIFELKAIVHETEKHCEIVFIKNGFKHFDWSMQRDVLININNEKINE